MSERSSQERTVNWDAYLVVGVFALAMGFAFYLFLRAVPAGYYNDTLLKWLQIGAFAPLGFHVCLGAYLRWFR